MPSADDLFRPTAEQPLEDDASQQSVDATSASVRRTARTAVQPAADRQPSGRVRHDEKMTVYVTAEELLDLESARLALRSRHGLAVDRGRLVREAVAMVLAELEAEGEQSRLVKRLNQQ